MAARPTTTITTTTTTRIAGTAYRRALAQPFYSRRPFSATTTTTRANAGQTTPDNAKSLSLPPPRWTSELPARIGKCLAFGCNPQQVSQAAAVLRVIATEWRDLLANSEGFLTGGRRGLEAREIAWGEMDTFAHVNNVNYYRFAESARVNWITHFAVHVDPARHRQWRELMAPISTGLIMRSLKADFKFPMVYPDRISVYHKLRARPEGGSGGGGGGGGGGGADPAPSSFLLDCVVLSHRHRRAACRLEEDIVIYDYKRAGKTGMPRFVLERFRETWALQEQAARRARARVWGLCAAVDRLEAETWNRPGAVEDMGAAKGS